MGGLSVIVLGVCVLVCSVGLSSGFGFPQPFNAFRQANEIQNFVHNQIRGMTPFAGGFPVRGNGVQFFNGAGGGGVLSGAAAGAGVGGGLLSGGVGGGTVVSTSSGGGTGGFVSTLGGGGTRYGGGSSSFVSTGGPEGGFGVIQTSSNLDGKQTGQVVINDNGKVTAYEIPSGGGTIFTMHSSQGGPGTASSSYSSSVSTPDGVKTSQGGSVEENGKVTTFST